MPHGDDRSSRLPSSETTGSSHAAKAPPRSPCTCSSSRSPCCEVRSVQGASGFGMAGRIGRREIWCTRATSRLAATGSSRTAAPSSAAIERMAGPPAGVSNKNGLDAAARADASAATQFAGRSAGIAHHEVQRIAGGEQPDIRSQRSDASRTWPSSLRSRARRRARRRPSSAATMSDSARERPESTIPVRSARAMRRPSRRALREKRTGPPFSATPSRMQRAAATARTALPSGAKAVPCYAPGPRSSSSSVEPLSAKPRPHRQGRCFGYCRCDRAR